MNEHDTDTRLRAWARSRADRQVRAELGRRVLDIPTDEATSRQRRRWLWFLSDPKPTAGAVEPQDRPRATDRMTSGPLPAPIGGTRTMFSATKLVGLAAAVALFGALLLASPLDPPGDVSAPPAAPVGQPGEITSFGGTLDFLSQDDVGIVTRHDWGTEAIAELWTIRYEADDRRFSGVLSGYYNNWVVQPGSNQLVAYNGRLYTEDGSWHLTGRGYTDPETGGIVGHEYAVGEGPYEGLHALVTLLHKPGASTVDFKGIIFEGGLPDTPESPPDEPPLVTVDT